MGSNVGQEVGLHLILTLTLILILTLTLTLTLTVTVTVGQEALVPLYSYCDTP